LRFAEWKNYLLPETLGSTVTPEPIWKPIHHFSHIQPPPCNPHFLYSHDLQKFLHGKQLLIEEIPFTIEELQLHYMNGYISYRIPIRKERSRLTCLRCGNNDTNLFASFSCAKCNEQCNYCRKCITMGRISECTPLISWTGPTEAYIVHPPILAWNGKLSGGQQEAANEVAHAVTNHHELLIWAVCGAGKTEVLFQGIETAILAKKQVCIATPRTDVVIELAPRLKAAFPTIDVIALYGGSEDRNKTAQLVIATTHQLLRFYQAFDVIIIDEVDAFPYSAEPMLEYAVTQAKKQISTTVLLTATPNKTMQKQVLIGKRKAVTIPARYHRQPLPVPEFKWCGNWQKKLMKNTLPANVLHWITTHLHSNKQAFLFVPYIEGLNQIVDLLKIIDKRIEGVHSEDPKRKEKVALFRSGEIPLLVTTTILERGVTVPNIDVAVLGAESQIFTESALVQISGRVGRSPKFPSGEILFFHYGKTNAMLAAKRQISRMNKEAIRKGLIDA